MKTKFESIIGSHIEMQEWESECSVIVDTLDWFTTEELVQIVRLIDAELQSRDLPTAQEFSKDDEASWENEGGRG